MKTTFSNTFSSFKLLFIFKTCMIIAQIVARQMQHEISDIVPQIDQ